MNYNNANSLVFFGELNVNDELLITRIFCFIKQRVR